MKVFETITIMAEETTGSGTRKEREDEAIQRIPFANLEEQQEFDRRRAENAHLASQGKGLTN